MVKVNLVGRIADGLFKRSGEFTRLNEEIKTKNAEAARLNEAAEFSGQTIFESLFGTTWSTGTSQRDMLDFMRERLSRSNWQTYAENSMASNWVNTMSNFIIGPGFSITHKEPAIDEVVQEYQETDKYKTTLITSLNRFLLDGEVPYLTFVNLLTGDLKLREFDPLELKEIAYDPDDYFNILAIRRAHTRREYSEDFKTYTDKDKDEWIKHGEVEGQAPFTIRDFLYFKRPTISNMQRGLSYLTPVVQDLRQLRQIMKSRAQLHRARASYALFLKLIGADDEKVQLWQSRMDSRGAPNPASVAVHNDKMEFEYKGPNLGSSEAAIDIRDQKLNICAGLNVPEAIGTADYSNANYGSTSIAAEVFKKPVQRLQLIFEFIIQDTFDVLLGAKIDAGRLPAGSDEIPVDVDYPDIMPMDLAALHALLSWANSTGIVTDETAAYLLPWEIDWETEKKRQEEQKDRKVKLYGGIPAEQSPYPPTARSPQGGKENVPNKKEAAQEALTP